MKSLLVLVALTSCLGSSLARADDCIFKDAIMGYSVDSNNSIIIDADGEYRVTVSMCNDLEFAGPIGFRSWSLNSLELCTGDDLIAQHGTEICPIESIQRQ